MVLRPTRSPTATSEAPCQCRASPAGIARAWPHPAVLNYGPSPTNSGARYSAFGAPACTFYRTDKPCDYGDTVLQASGFDVVDEGATGGGAEETGSSGSSGTTSHPLDAGLRARGAPALPVDTGAGAAEASGAEVRACSPSCGSSPLPVVTSEAVAAAAVAFILAKSLVAGLNIPCVGLAHIAHACDVPNCRTAHSSQK